MRGISQSDLDHWFRYHPPTDGQLEQYVTLRNQAKLLAETIVRIVPSGPDQSAAIRKLRECVMTANAAIACNQEG